MTYRIGIATMRHQRRLLACRALSLIASRITLIRDLPVVVNQRLVACVRKCNHIAYVPLIWEGFAHVFKRLSACAHARDALANCEIAV
jgi:hypothetical protein